MAERFKVAPYGATAWIWTIAYLIFMLYFAISAIGEVVNGFVPDPIDGVLTIVLVPLMIYAWVRSVRGYRLEAGEVIVDRAGPGKIHIPLSQIDQLDSHADLGSFFNQGFLSLGGVFGWAGRVSVRKPTDVKSVQAEVYGTNPGKMLVLDMKSGNKIILTPTDPQAMETALRIAGAGPQPGSGSSSTKPRLARSGKRK